MDKQWCLCLSEEAYIMLRTEHRIPKMSSALGDSFFSSLPTFSLSYSFISLTFCCTQSSMKLHLFTPVYWSYHYWNTEQIIQQHRANLFIPSNERRKLSELLLPFHMILAETWESWLNIHFAYQSCITVNSWARFIKLHSSLSKEARIFLNLSGA